MLSSKIVRVRLEVASECGHDAMDLVFKDPGARFPYSSFTPLHASLGVLAVARPNFCAMSHYRRGLAEDITRAAAHQTSSCILVKGSEPLLEIEKVSRPDLPMWRIVVASDAVSALDWRSGSAVGVYDQTRLEILRAPFESRDCDVFPESGHWVETNRRRQVWTAACLSASTMLPCEPSRFLQAAEIIAHALNPQLPWNADEESLTGRIAAAIRAGIVVPDLSLTKLCEHPSLEAWRQILGARASSCWPIITRTATDIALLTGRIRHTLQAWARHLSGHAQASGHDLLDAQAFLDTHRDEFDALRSALFKQVSPFPMPPPLEKI